MRLLLKEWPWELKPLPSPNHHHHMSSEYAQLLQLEKHPVGIAVKLHYLKGLKEKVISDGGKPNAHTNTVHICFVLCAQFVVLTSSNSVRCQQSEDCLMYLKPIIQLTHHLALFMTYFCFATTSRDSENLFTSLQVFQST